jgi:Cell wall-active antibiotics response 4TMS YvqF
MEHFDEGMNRFHERMNRKWQRRQAGWESRSNWQPSSNWYNSSEPRLNEVNVFWGGRRRVISKNFQGGEIVAIFGGFEIDLTEADFQANQIVIEVVTIFGGGEIRVPPNWEVLVDSVGIFGGTGDRTNHPAGQTSVSSAQPTKKLIIKGVSIFGGLTLKN